MFRFQNFNGMIGLLKLPHGRALSPPRSAFSLRVCGCAQCSLVVSRRVKKDELRTVVQTYLQSNINSRFSMDVGSVAKIALY